MKFIIISIITILLMLESYTAQDWANLYRFKKDNDSLMFQKSNESRIVFMGNSITEGWEQFCPDFFNKNGYINRGISGQTTPQMLLRFRQDVINLKPKVVIILAGTNDIAGNTGPSSLQMILGNIISMSELAKVNGIDVILASVIPAYDYPWEPGQKPHQKIPELNNMIKTYAIKNDIYYLDYFSSMADANNGLLKEYTYDGVHPNKKGYKVMIPLAEKAIADVLRK